MKRRDITIAVLATVAVQAEIWTTSLGIGASVAGLSTLALAWVRTHPLLVLPAISAAVLVESALGGRLMMEASLPAVAVAASGFPVGLHAQAPRALAAVVLATAALATASQVVVGGDEYSALDDLVFFTLVVGGPALLGQLLRRRGETIAELAARTAALREARKREADAAVAEERALLADRVHGALARRVGDIALDAAGAERRADQEPAQTIAALQKIEGAGRAVLSEIRTAIGVLRRGDHLPASPQMPRALPERSAREPEAPAQVRQQATPRLDPLAAAVVFTALAVETLGSSRLEGPALANVAGVAATAVPLAWRRRNPLASAAAVYGAANVQSLLLTPMEFLVTPTALLLLPTYSIAAHLPRAKAIPGLGLFAVGTFALGPSVLTGFLGIAAWAGGRAVRDRAQRAEELHAVNDELELSRELEAARARSEERLRISRELHDAVAHRMTVIVLQAGASRRVWSERPAAAREALGVVVDVAEETLGDLRVVLGEEGPVPSLEELVDRVTPLGLEITVSGQVGPLDRLSFSVIREALTNVVRHAAPTSVRIDFDRSESELVIRITDSGRSGPGDPMPVVGTQTGLRGLAERVEANGGQLIYGPLEQGFMVEARLPIAVPRRA